MPYAPDRELDQGLSLDAELGSSPFSWRAPSEHQSPSALPFPSASSCPISILGNSFYCYSLLCTSS